MRNLKRALSLALASVMLVGMMVVGSSAASYPDVDDDNNVEAISVLNAVEVMIGNENGDFEPDKNVTRNEMAVIMAKLILGTYEADSYVGSHPFTDVPDWASKYVAACYSSGIIAGRSADTYDGQSTVTAVEAAAMMLRALGYEDLSKGAAQWDQPVAAKANEISLFENLNGAGNAAMNRDSVAQLALNTLKSTMVTTVRDGQDITLPDGTTIVGTRRYELRVTNYGWKDAIDDEGDTSAGSNRGGYIQLGEYLYKGDLRLEDTTDKFGRPSDAWMYKGNEICTAASTATYTYTGKVTGKDLYNTLGNTVVKDYVWTVKVDGKPDTVAPVDDGKGYSQLLTAKDNGDDAMLGTGNGVLTEVYVDRTEKTVVLSVINTYVAKVIRAKAVDDKYEVTVRYETGTPSTTGFDRTVKVDDDSFKADDIVLITVADDAIQSIDASESITGDVTAVKGTDYIKLDSKQYDKAVGYKNIGDGDDSMPAVGETAVVYLDKYGNMIAVDAEGVTVDDYLFITDDSKGLGGLSAEAVFSDGTKKDIKITKIDSTEGKDLSDGDAKDKIWSFTEDDGKYTLKTVANVGVISSYTNGVITKGSTEVITSESDNTHKVTAGNKTVFVDVKNEKVYEGYAEVPSITSAKVVAVNNATTNLAEIVFITDGESSADSSFWFFVKSDKYEETGKSTKYREYTVYTKDGEDTLVTKNMTAPADLTDEDSTLKKNALYKAKSITADDQLTAFNTIDSKDLTADLAEDTTSGNATVAKDGVLTLNAATNDLSGASKRSFTYNSDKTVFLVIEANDAGDGAKEVGIGSANDIAIIGNGTTPESIVYILSVDDKSDTTPLATMVVVVNPAEAAAPAPAPGTPTINNVAGTAAVPGFSAGSKSAGTPATGATADMSGGNVADVSSIKAINNLNVGGVTVDLSGISISDGDATTAVIAAIQGAVDAAVTTHNSNGAKGTSNYDKIEDAVVSANSTTGFKVAFNTTTMTYSATNTPAVARKTTVDFNGLTGEDVIGATLTIDGKVYEFLTSGDSAAAGNVKVTVAESDAAAAIATALGTAATGAANLGANVASTSVATTVVTFTGTTTATTALTSSWTAAS